MSSELAACCEHGNESSGSIKGLAEWFLLSQEGLRSVNLVGCLGSCGQNTFLQLCFLQKSSWTPKLCGVLYCLIKLIKLEVICLFASREE
jgi:hypothetical protein